LYYWIFLILFIIAVMIPDLIRGPLYFLNEERIEEISIFLMGVTVFLILMKNEYKLSIQKKEKENDQKKIKQAVADLVESYSYIGEVNRKMDILMSIALGLSDKSALNKDREKDIYLSILSAANFLMKANCSFLRFIDSDTSKNLKEIRLEKKKNPVKNEELLAMKNGINLKECSGCLVISSPQKIHSIKSYLIISGYDEEEKSNSKNIEILKVFASQALFLYSYLSLEKENGRK